MYKTIGHLLSTNRVQDNWTLVKYEPCTRQLDTC